MLSNSAMGQAVVLVKKKPQTVLRLQAGAKVVFNLPRVFPCRPAEQNSGLLTRDSRSQNVLLQIVGHVTALAVIVGIDAVGNPLHLVEFLVAEDDAILHQPPAEKDYGHNHPYRKRRQASYPDDLHLAFRRHGFAH